MTGLYPGLDGFLPSTLIEIVNTCLDFMIEAVKNKGVTIVVYIFTHKHTQHNTYIQTHTHALTNVCINRGLLTWR